MKKFLFLILIVCSSTYVFGQKIKKGKEEAPNWLQESYLNIKYPESQYLWVLENTGIKRLNEDEVIEAKNTLNKTMMEELARRISVSVNVNTSQTSTNDDIVTDGIRNISSTSSFEEQLKITANAEFQFEYKDDYKDKHMLWSIMVINKSACAIPLIVNAIDILQSTISQVEVALDSRSSKYLPDFEKKLKLASQMHSSAFALDNSVDKKSYQSLKNKLSALIQEVRQLESEQRFDESIEEIDNLVDENKYGSAIDKCRKLNYRFKDRVEISEKMTEIKNLFRKHTQFQIQKNNTDLQICISFLNEYLSYFSEDILLRNELNSLQIKLFDTLAHEAELAIEEQMTDLAKKKVNQIDSIKITNLERFNRIKKKLSKLEYNELLRIVESYWKTKKYFNGWNLLSNTLKTSTKYLEDAAVLRWKKKFGKKCKKSDFKDARKSEPYRLVATINCDLRSNSFLVKDAFNTSSSIKIQSGYFTYSGSFYLRRISNEKISIENGKTRDKSKSTFLGVKINYLDYDSVMKLGSYDGDITPPSEYDQAWELTTDLYKNNFYHLGLGLHHDGDLSALLSNNSFISTIGLQIPFNGKRGGFNIKSDVNLIKTPGQEAMFCFSAGISLNEYFFQVLNNKKEISIKYK